ncbi:MAG TPA: acyltransferase [Opitutaceae bacterium]|jgi:peptidoglycan/LPS O-acetylase OafA/YrhL|nr:acyltransferase [Opitutaceae bacterium]
MSTRPPPVPDSVGGHLAGHGNAVTALRLGLAGLVVLGHAYEVGGFGFDPLRRAAGVTSGEIGVNGFFALSGYLVAQSWRRSPGPAEYLRRRVRRIFPAFWACLALTGLGLFPLLWVHRHGGSWAPAALSRPFLSYAARNSLLWIRQGSVADLFAGQPAQGVANGSLWSLFPEFLCYLGVAAAGLAGARMAGRRTLAAAAVVALAALQAAGPWILPRLAPAAQPHAWYLWRVATQASFFGAGALAWLHRGRLRVGAGPALGAAAALAAAAAAGLYAWAAPWLLTFLLLQLASLLPGKSLERVGDYSYGLYLYHYPLQQMLLYLGWKPANAAVFFAVSLGLAAPVAILSWHGIERPALGRKQPLARPLPCASS